MAVGRLMREHKLQAGVATTIPQGCNPPALSHLVTELDTDACLALKRSGGVLVSKFNTELTRCASACVYALAGGIVRDIPISAQIFVHAGIVVTVNKKTGKVTRRLRDDELSVADRAKSKSEDLELVSYLRQMGVDPALFYAAQKVSNDTSRALTRKEIADFGIDSRTVVEGAWQATTTDVAKRMIERKGRETEYHQKTFRFRCSGEGDVSVQYLSPVLDSTEVGHFHEIKARIADGEFTLVPLPALNEARLPTAFFKRVLAADHIALNEMADETQANKPTRSFRLSTAGLAAPLAALLERCDSSPPALNTPKTSASAQSTNVSNNANPSTLLNPPITCLKWEVPKPDVPGRAMADEKE